MLGSREVEGECSGSGEECQRAGEGVVQVQEKGVEQASSAS